MLKLDERGVDSHAKNVTILQSRAEQSRAEQSRAEQSRAWANCALFASCGALETAYYIRDGIKKIISRRNFK